MIFPAHKLYLARLIGTAQRLTADRFRFSDLLPGCVLLLSFAASTFAAAPSPDRLLQQELKQQQLKTTTQRLAGQLAAIISEFELNAIGGEDVKLKLSLNRAAGNKMLRGQYEFNKANSVYGQKPMVDVTNSAVVCAGVPQNAPGYINGNDQVNDRDEEVAESQALGVVNRQQITVTKAMPLRVNLPVCGVPLSFAQSLQTEVNKPLTLQFAASRTDKIGISTVVMAAAALGLR